MEFDALDRISTVRLGTGYTPLRLPQDGSAEYTWYFAQLSDGCIVVFLGFEWFSR
jgi:hypothetical protein